MAGLEEVGQLLKAELVDAKQSTSLLGTGEKASLLNAALINGTIGHVLDYDDSNKLMMGHPTAPIFPALLALAENKIEVPNQHLKICNIEVPTTGLETKFSMKHIAAMTLYGAETARVEAYTDTIAADPKLKALAQQVSIIADREPGMDATVTVTKKDGTVLSKFADVGIPETDLAKQQHKVEAKFLALTSPILLTGATGMTGGLILDLCLKSDQVKEVISLKKDIERARTYSDGFVTD